MRHTLCESPLPAGNWGPCRASPARMMASSESAVQVKAGSLKAPPIHYRALYCTRCYCVNDLILASLDLHSPEQGVHDLRPCARGIRPRNAARGASGAGCWRARSAFTMMDHQELVAYETYSRTARRPGASRSNPRRRATQGCRLSRFPRGGSSGGSNALRFAGALYHSSAGFYSRRRDDMGSRLCDHAGPWLGHSAEVVGARA